jgi:hypothetical protein
MKASGLSDKEIEKRISVFQTRHNTLQEIISDIDSGRAKDELSKQLTEYKKIIEGLKKELQVGPDK